MADKNKPIEEEPLLELHRNFSDKEKLEWLISEHRILKKEFQKVVSENKTLKIENSKFRKQIKDDDLQLPSTLNGRETVTVKAYMKLRRRCGMFETRVWELVSERNRLQVDCERL